MVVRIRFARPSLRSEKRLRNQRLALAFAALLQPPAVAALSLALWRIFASFQWVASFAIPNGVFSHWQTWAAAAVGIWLCASALDRYGNSGGPAAV
jgi:hypothetical protein